MNYGRYGIQKELGSGSVGVVFLAHDPHIDRQVALKVLRPDLVTSEAFVQRFLKEAKAIGRLSHPNIVTVYDVGKDHGTIYIAMEFLDGEPLIKLVGHKEFSEKEIVHLGIQVAAALDYAHGNRIVHRDIKPANIILTSKGLVKITDFGIARIEDPSADQQTRAGEILGTPAYMSPEQILGQPVDGRSDIYSCGVLFYELSTGVRPFRGENLAAIFRAVTQDIPADPTKVKPSVSPGLSQIIMKCLSKEPDQRFQTCRAMAEAMEGCLKAEVSIPVAKVGARRKSKSLAITIAALLLVAGIGGGVYYHQVSKRQTETPRVSRQGLTTTPTTRPPVVGLAVVKVGSEPTDAQVFVDREFKGSTPLQLELPVGKHEIRLALSDYHDWKAKIQLNEKSVTPLLVRLLPIEGGAK